MYRIRFVPARPASRRAARSAPLLSMLLSGLMLLGCATTPPSSFYVLTPIPEATQRFGEIQGGGLAIGIGPVVFPQFLDRPQLVTRDGSNRLKVDEFHRWGGTVQDDFLRVWGENVAHLLGTSRVLVFPSESRMPLDFRITAEVIAFEGRADDSAVLKVRWAVMDDRLERVLAAREDAYRCPVRPPASVPRPAGSAAAASAPASSGNAEGTEAPGALGGDSEAVVAAMSRCLGEFSRDVASVVASLPKPKPEQEASAVTVSPL
jgi:uncharacterized lipoprotein YmbA